MPTSDAPSSCAQRACNRELHGSQPSGGLLAAKIVGEQLGKVLSFHGATAEPACSLRPWIDASRAESPGTHWLHWTPRDGDPPIQVLLALSVCDRPLDLCDFWLTPSSALPCAGPVVLPTTAGRARSFTGPCRGCRSCLGRPRAAARTGALLATPGTASGHFAASHAPAGRP